VIEREFPSGNGGEISWGLIKGGRLRDRKKAPSRSGLPEGDPQQPSFARCLQMSRRTVGPLFSVALQAAASMRCCWQKAAKPKDDPEREQFLFSAASLTSIGSRD